MDILTLVTSASAAVDLTTRVAETVKELSKKMGDIETQRLIVTLAGDIVTLRSQNTELRSHLLKLQEEQQTKANIERSSDGKILYLKDEEQKHPYCPRCWDWDIKLVGMSTDKYGGIRCPQCKTEGKPSEYPPIERLNNSRFT